MKNIKCSVVGATLVLEVDLSGPCLFETKGGNEMIATTGNWQALDIGPGWTINMVVVKNPRKALVPGAGLRAVGQ